MATSFHRPPIAGIEGLNRVGRAEHSPYLCVVIEERNELLPSVGPQSDDRRIPLTPVLGEIVQPRVSGSLGRCRVDRSEIVFECVPVLTSREPKGVGSTRGAVSGLLPVRFLGPPAEPGVRFSPHRALRKGCRSCLLSVDQPRVGDTRPAISVAFDRHRRGLK